MLLVLFSVSFPNYNIIMLSGWKSQTRGFEKYKTLISVLITSKEVMFGILYSIASTTEGLFAKMFYK